MWRASSFDWKGSCRARPGGLSVFDSAPNSLITQHLAGERPLLRAQARAHRAR